MNMFKAVKATGVADYITSVPDDRRESIEWLHAFIQAAVPALKPYFANNMIGYGSFNYRNYKHEEVLWPIIALANQKNYISVYVCAVDDGRYLAESYKDRLGKVSVGRSCIRFKRIEDVNLAVLKKILQLAAKSPGLPK